MSRQGTDVDGAARRALPLHPIAHASADIRWHDFHRSYTADGSIKASYNSVVTRKYKSQVASQRAEPRGNHGSYDARVLLGLCRQGAEAR